MSRTGYARTMVAAPLHQRPNASRLAAGIDWEVLAIHRATPASSQPWHAAIYAAADVDAGTVGQLRLRSSGAVAATATGVWSTAAGKIIDPNGSVFQAAGMNGGAPLALGQFGSSAGEYVAWTMEGFPQFTLSTDIWPGQANLFSGNRMFPGGHINGGRYWSNELNTWADLPDRVYALTGVRSADAITLGIAQPTDHWHSRLYRMVCYLRSGALTWEAGVVADTTVPEYVARARELVDLGLVVAVEDHGFTAADATLPSGLVSDPMLAVGSVTDGPVRDTLKLIDAFAAEFPGGSENVWFCLPNEPYTVAATDTRYRDFVKTLAVRLRGKGFTGLLSIPLAHYGQDLHGLAIGSYNTLINELNALNVGPFVWEFHNYGKRWNAGASTIYTYAEMDSDLAQCQANGRAVWMGEYGQGVPLGSTATGSATADREGVLITATNTYGEALGLKYPHICPAWWAIADHTFDRTYSLTYGAANLGNEAGPNPNTTGAPNKGTFPMWDVDGVQDWLTPGGQAHWDLAHLIDSSGAEVVGVSPPVVVSAYARNIRLGFEGVPSAEQLIYVEGRRISGTGGLRLLDSRATLVSAPPLALRTSTPPPSSSGGGGGGGGTTTASDVRSTFVADTEGTTFTILPSWFSPAAEPGDKIVLLGGAPGPSDVGSFTFTFPGTQLFNTASTATTYNPRLIGTVADYSAGGWTVSGTSNFRAAAICFRDTVGVAASAPVQGFSPQDPGSVANQANAVGVAVSVLNFTTAAVTAPASGHTTIVSSPLVPRQFHIAKLGLSAAGTYNPAAATAGPGSEESVVVSIVAQPSATAGGIAAPTVPTFNSGSAIALSTLSADIAAAVAAQPAGTHFQLSSGTYTNWSNVRPKTGMHFKGPASGTATLEGTGKVWAFRAIDATGSSDNVTISGPVGSIKIQNYGGGTARGEYGAIQAQPTDTSVGSSQYTYGVAQGWFVQGVTLEKNSANGYRMGDYSTAYQVTSYGHTVTGIGADRCVGGLIHTCTLEANGLNPATGASSNGANIKITFHNASEGRTAILPSGVQRAKAPLRVANCTFNATRSGISGTCQIGFWADLDCQQIEVYDSAFTNHPATAIFFEGCNNVLARGNTVTNSDGYGPAGGGDFINGAICLGETTNGVVEDNDLSGCDYALVQRQSNRSADWYNSNNSSYVNYSWPATSGGVRYWIDAGQTIPSTSGRSNMWSGNNIWRNNTLTSCSKVVINEGSNGGGMACSGSTPLATIQFIGNDYSGSSGILFYDRSNTGISLSAWRALPYDRDQP